jgi:F0F1-type ATP synthase assembly protein I
MKNGNDDKRPNRWSDYTGLALVGEVGLTIALSMLAGVGIGHFIDSKLGTSPIATLIGLLLGLAAGIYGVYRLISSL